MPISKVALIAELEDLSRNVPESIASDEISTWLGRAAAAIEAWDPARRMDVIAHKGTFVSNRKTGFGQMRVLLEQARASLRLETIGAVGMAVDGGAVHTYYDAVRSFIEAGDQDVFVIDPYLDAEFVTRYLPSVPKSATVRLLTRERLATLLPAVELFASEHKTDISVRSADFHDRYIIINRGRCAHSSASFKDGGRLAPATIVEPVDLFATIHPLYERRWSEGAQRFPR